MNGYENKRNEIIDFCNRATLAANEIEEDNDCHIIIKKMAQQIRNRVEMVENMCSVEKYNLYFNGKVGLGKSTAICTLLNLIDSIKLKEESRLAQSLLLKTGSGRTTVCETRIIPNSSKSHIEIEKIPYNDFKIYVKEFCKWIDGEESDFSEEESRVIKNMCEIPLKLKTSDEVKDFLKVLTYNNFDYILEVINYNSRNTNAFYFKDNDELDFNSWLKTTYENINDGKLKGCPMPSKIYVHISEKDFELNLPKFINSVIDTKGIDGGERADIQEYISLNNSISLMCDEVNGFGGNDSILSILKQILIKENKDIKYRTILLGLEKGKELENITDCEGNKSEGIRTKISQAEKKFTDNSIFFEKNNMVFLNSAPGIGIQYNVITEIHNIEKEAEQLKFYKELQGVLERMYAEYFEEVCDSLKILNQLANGKITQSTINKFINCQKFVVQGKEESKQKSNTIINRFEDASLGIYHSSLRGAVNHNGIGRTADIYASFQKCGGEEFSERCQVQKANILALIKETFENCDEIEKTCYQSIIDEIDKVYLRLYSEARKEHHDRTFQNLYNDTAWYSPKKYWGDGLSNYNIRVTIDIIAEMKKLHIDTELIKMNLEIKFFDEILEFLEIV